MNLFSIGSVIKTRLAVLLMLMVFVFSSVFAPLALAEDRGGTWYNQTFQEWHKKVYDDSNPEEIFGERYTAAQVQWVIYGLASFIMNGPGGEDAANCALTEGQDLNDCSAALMDTVKELLNPSSGDTSAKPDSANFLSVLSNNPVSFVSYVSDLKNRLSIVPEAKAQEGFGFQAASPVLILWRASRNISYLLLIIAIVTMSFMIMFRVKISPQTVITVQSALPKIAIALILITFSYAIAGLLIDLMYVVLGLVMILLSGAGISAWNPIELFNHFATNTNVFNLMVSYWAVFMVAAIGAAFSFGTIIPGLLVFIFAIISIVILLWYTIKIIFLLLKNFVLIMLTIITGPFEILFGTVAQGTGFGSWIRKLISYLAVYPLMAIMFLLAFFFASQGSGNIICSTGDCTWILGLRVQAVAPSFWDPPMTFGTLAGANLLWLVVSYAIVVLTPKTYEIIQGLMSGKPFAYGTAIGESMAPAKWAGMYGAGSTASYLERTGGPTSLGGSPVSQRRLDVASVIRAATGVKR